MRKLLLAALAAALLAGGIPAEARAHDAAAEAAQNVAIEEKAPESLQSEPQEGQIFEVAKLSSRDYREDYRLTKYDTIGLLSIGYQQELGDQTYTVGPDGRIQLPYVGSVKLAGLTLDEARDVITEAFGRYFRKPEISLVMKSYGARSVYVMGEVKTPGVTDLKVDNLNAYAAISAAGGPTSHGRMSKAQVIRVVDGTMYYRPIDLNRYVKKHDLTQNVVLEDGDIVYVPSTNGIIWNEDVVPFLNAMTGVYSVKKIFE